MVHVEWVNHTGRVAIVTPNDRSMSVRNRCVIERLRDNFVLTLCLLTFPLVQEICS